MISSILKLMGNKMKPHLWIKMNLIASKSSLESFAEETLQNTGWIKRLNTKTSVERLQFIRSNVLTSAKKEMNLGLLIPRGWMMSNQPKKRKIQQFRRKGSKVSLQTGHSTITKTLFRVATMQSRHFTKVIKSLLKVKM